MRNWRKSYKRVVFYASHLLGSKAIAVYIITALFSLLIALSITYRIYAILTISSFFLIFVVSLVIMSVASGIIDELNSGVASMILASGLSRREYVLSWLLASIIYPVLIITLSLVLPALIINPEMLFEEIRFTPFSKMLSLGLLSVTFAEQVFINTIIAIGLGIIFRKKSLAWIVLVIFVILIPIIGTFISSLIIIPYGVYSSKLYYMINYIINFFFNPYYACWFAYMYDPKSIILPLATISVSGIIGAGSFAILLSHVKNNMEV